MIESKIDNVPNATDDESEDDEEMVVPEGSDAGSQS